MMIPTKTKKHIVEAEVTMRRGKWTVKCEGETLGRVDGLVDATALLYRNGYKVYCYRRSETKGGKPRFISPVLVFEYKEGE